MWSMTYILYGSDCENWLRCRKCSRSHDLPLRRLTSTVYSSLLDLFLITHIKQYTCCFWACLVSRETIFSVLYPYIPQVQFSSIQLLSHVWLCNPMYCKSQVSLSIINSRSSLRPKSIESVMPSSHLIFCRPLLLLPPIPPSIRVFSNESTLCMRWPKYWSFSFSIISPEEFQGGSPSEWTGWISLQSKGLSRVFSNTTVQKHQFFSTRPSSHPTLTSIHDHWKKHSLD